MAVEKDEHGNISITEQDIPLFQILALRAMLRMEVNSGLKSSKGSPFKMLKILGVIPVNIRTKREGLEIVNAYIENEKKARENNADS